MEILNLARLVQTKTQWRGNEASATLKHFFRDDWLWMSRDSRRIRLSPRLLTEMRGYITDTYPKGVGACRACKKPSYHGGICECGARFHWYCLLRKDQTVEV